MSQKTIVTGASGFIGEHMVKLLDINDFEYGAVYREAPPESGPGSGSRHIGDLLDQTFLSSSFEGYDVVVHLGGRTGGGQLESPADFVSGNVETTANVLRAAQDAGVKRVVVASSYEAYGVPSTTPIEETHPLAPTTPYGITMQMREALSQTLGHAYGIDTFVTRFFSVFGQPVTEHNRKGAIASFVRRLQNDEELTLMGQTSTLRDYVYVADVVRCLMACIGAGSSGSQTINVGSGDGCSLDRIVKALEGHFNDLRVSHTPAAAGAKEYDVVASTDAMRDVLGFQCQYNVESGISEMLESEGGAR
jgi:UDP-glucose 4-epimerase